MFQLTKQNPSTSKMKVVSFDIGKNNLAWCTVEADPLAPDSARLLDCKLIALQGGNLQQWVQSMFDQLHDKSKMQWTGHIDACLIELQPSLNPKAVALSQALHMMFLAQHIPVHFCSPSKKLAGLVDPPADVKLPKDKYKRRKALSVYHAMQLADAAGKRLLQAHAKKDDVCDAMLMAISWLRSQPVSV